MVYKQYIDAHLQYYRGYKIVIKLHSPLVKCLSPCWSFFVKIFVLIVLTLAVIVNSIVNS